MSTFSITAVPNLDYDFTGFASNADSTKNCKGKGVIPEPSQPRLEAYSAAMRDLFKVDEDATDAERVEQVQEAIEADAKAKSESLLQLTADLCQDKPSKAELDELPPRICRGFLKWIYKELTNPEV